MACSVVLGLTGRCLRQPNCAPVLPARPVTAVSQRPSLDAHSHAAAQSVMLPQKSSAHIYRPLLLDHVGVVARTLSLCTAAINYNTSCYNKCIGAHLIANSGVIHFDACATTIKYFIRRPKATGSGLTCRASLTDIGQTRTVFTGVYKGVFTTRTGHRITTCKNNARTAFAVSQERTDETQCSHALFAITGSFLAYLLIPCRAKTSNYALNMG